MQRLVLTLQCGNAGGEPAACSINDGCFWNVNEDTCGYDDPVKVEVIFTT